MSTESDEKSDQAIIAMVTAVTGTAIIPAHVNWALTATAMGVGVVAIGNCYGVQVNKEEAWQLIKEFIRAAGFWYVGMAVGSKIVAAILSSTGIGHIGAIALDATISAAIAYATGACAKVYFKGERNKKVLGEAFRKNFEYGKEKYKK